MKTSIVAFGLLVALAAHGPAYATEATTRGYVLGCPEAKYANEFDAILRGGQYARIGVFLNTHADCYQFPYHAHVELERSDGLGNDCIRLPSQRQCYWAPHDSIIPANVRTVCPPGGRCYLEGTDGKRYE